MKRRWFWMILTLGVGGYWGIWPTLTDLATFSAACDANAAAAEMTYSRLRRDYSETGLAAAVRNVFPKSDKVLIRSGEKSAVTIEITCVDLNSSVAELPRIRWGAWVLNSISVNSADRFLTLKAQR